MSVEAAAPAPQPNAATPAVPAPANVSTPPAPAPAPAVDPNQPAPLNVSAPAAPPTPAPEQSVIVQYTPTGDQGLDLALEFVGNLGFGPERAEIQAAQKGDFAPLEASLKALGDKAKGFEKFLGVAKDSHSRVVQSKQAKEKATLDAVVAAAGGVKEWNALQAWVVAEASDEQKAAINAAFAQGGFAAESVVRSLAQLYAQSGVSKNKPAAVVKPTAAGEPAKAEGALSASEYKAGVRALEAKYGYRLTETDEYKALSARRLAAIRG